MLPENLADLLGKPLVNGHQNGWKDFSPSAAAALFMPDIHTIRLHDIAGHSS
jgi:hypothetical protein